MERSNPHKAVMIGGPLHGANRTIHEGASLSHCIGTTEHHYRPVPVHLWDDPDRWPWYYVGPETVPPPQDPVPPQCDWFECVGCGRAEGDFHQASCSLGSGTVVRGLGILRWRDPVPEEPKTVPPIAAFFEGFEKSIRLAAARTAVLPRPLDAARIAIESKGPMCQCDRPALWDGETCVKCHLEGPQPPVLPF